MASLLAKQEAARKEIAEVNGGVMPEEAAFGEPNPIYAQVKLRQIEIDTQIEELRRRAAAARTEAEALAAKAEDVPRGEAEFPRLNRDSGIIKIGRAAWRERVGEEGEIAVGEVCEK